MVLWCAELSTRNPVLTYQPNVNSPLETELHLQSIAIAAQHVNDLVSSLHGRPFVGGTVQGQSSLCVEVAVPGNDTFYTICHLGGTQCGVQFTGMACEPGTRFRMGALESYSRAENRSLSLAVHLIGSEHPSGVARSS